MEANDVKFAVMFLQLTPAISNSQVTGGKVRDSEKFEIAKKIIKS